MYDKPQTPQKQARWKKIEKGVDYIGAIFTWCLFIALIVCIIGNLAGAEWAAM